MTAYDPNIHVKLRQANTYSNHPDLKRLLQGFDKNTKKMIYVVVWSNGKKEVLHSMQDVYALSLGLDKPPRKLF